MSWFHVNDDINDNEKIISADERGLGAWTKLGAWSAKRLTDGVVPGNVARKLCTKAGLAAGVAARIVVRDEAADTYAVSGYLDCNPSAERVRERRAGDVSRQNKHRSHEPVTRDTSRARPATLALALALAPALAPDPDPSGGSAAPPGPAPRPARKPKAPKPEGPEGVAWRTWREAYQAHYRRPYPAQSTDGPAMKRLVKLAQELLELVGRPVEEQDMRPGPRPPSDLEVLLVHRWRRYLQDPGQSRQPGGPGYLAETCHRLQDVERGLAAYGTPWDRLKASPTREPVAVPCRRPAPRFAPGNEPVGDPVVLPDVEHPPHVDVVGMFRGQA